ncbi:clathrin interactor EPSIN 1-like isoform X1 [Bidens hawaiensis]|uniref:clathrin interactor EPSIN 1-like isoform X1 n=1 Tax=Bidens hawaiensis TaxID=980011 RepID=UPI00404A37BC
MDFMKVIDQTVREIKREVNLKVLKVPEIEQKVLDATDDEPWGPHGTALAEIAQATKKFSECQMVMNVLWARLTETDRNWRHVYKALAVIEYLVANGSERAVDDIIEHTFQISSLACFEYVEPNGKDSGINVRKKVENIVSLLNDKEKIQATRNKAAANREKYVGLSSTGITFKSGSATSMSSSSFKSDPYGGYGSSRDNDTYKDSFKERDQSNEDRFEPGKFKPRKDVSSGSSLKKGSSRYGSAVQDSTTTGASKPSTKSASDKYSSISSQTTSAPSNNNDDDFDDFDPRGTSTAKAATVSTPQVDLFGESLIGDLLDVPTSGPTQSSNGNNISEEVDLFADAAFVSAPTNGTSGSENKVDLFASAPASFAASSTVDFFAVPEQVVEPEVKPLESKTTSTQTVDPFAAVPLTNFDNPDFFGSFSSNAGSVPTEPTQSFMDSSGLNTQNSKTAAPPLKKDGFQVKSGVWADSLSRGLIDLNITGPKKVDLTDVGIVGGLSTGPEEKDKGLPNSLFMGQAMGSGSGLGKSTGFTTSATTDMDDFFSSLSGPQNQYGSFQK